ncbi:undecaprenyl-phosphate alpha-N-acetylglucosaminyl 1-phosphate transferase [Bacteroides sedimenti]|uniref:Undecaprenyl-phosphate alpha-N-acetylglucosaminyl 1-phosphate transferase n=2 Tax=Bacteroides sedimenti TaxID=2136147 RepID=A0ABM8ICE4_9BACE
MGSTATAINLTNMINDYYLLIGLLLFSLTSSIALEMMALPRIIYIAKKKGLYDIPNGRKSHITPVPRLAGITFLPILMLVFSICSLIIIKQSPIETVTIFGTALRKMVGFVAGSIVLAGIGIKDDLVGSRYSHKMLAQFIAACLLVSGGLYINDFNGLFGINEVPAWFGVPFTILLTVFITNAMNLIDGADGLASGIAGVALISLGTMFFIRSMFFYSLICVILVGILIPFFYYNVFNTNRKVFMGDTGSLSLGFLLAYLGIRFAMNIPSSYGTVDSPALISLSALFIPLFDALRVMIERAIKGKSMFMPDRRHLHHKLLDLGLSHRKVMINIVFWAQSLVIFNIMMVHIVNINLVFLFDIALWFGLIQLLNALKKKQKTRFALFF